MGPEHPTNPFETEEYGKCIQPIPKALIACTPQHLRSAFCVVRECRQHGPGRLEYSIGSKERPDQVTAAPSPQLHEACHGLYAFYQKNKLGFPGIRVEVAALPGGPWNVRLEMLDGGKGVPLRGKEEMEKMWQAVYEARAALFVDRFGPLPQQILKVMSLTGVWPSGGIYGIEAVRMKGASVCASFGLSNFDMPTSMTSRNAHATADGGVSMQIAGRTPRWVPAERAGYGYEQLVATVKPAPWPVNVVAQLVQLELLRDAEILDAVEEFGGFLVGSLGVGPAKKADFLIAPARPPLPAGGTLPNGKVTFLVATPITPEEMAFADKNEPAALLKQFAAAGVSQFGDLNRRSFSP